MSENHLGAQPTNSSIDQPLLREPRISGMPRRRATDRLADDALTRFEEEQLAREYADIERATTVLRVGEPALQSWKPSLRPLPKTRPLWFLIGVLWLSTAIVTAGAVAAIASLAG